MKIEEIALSRVVENDENPRTITNENFQKLVKSIINFPRMLTLRPVVVDETMTVLGGNMRLKALRHITTMQEDGIADKMADKLTQGERDALLAYWAEWQKKPTMTIVNADDLTEEQKREFIIKDNVGFGEWDSDELANKWDTEQLQEWGIPSWQIVGYTSGDNLKNEPSEGAGDDGGGEAKEINVDSFDDKVEVKLHFTIEENIYINDKFLEYGDTKEKAILNLLGYGKGED